MNKPNPKANEVTQKLLKDCRIQDFSCGTASFDIWLKKYAWQSQSSDIAATYIVTNSKGEVIGYYSLCAAEIAANQVITRIAKGQPAKRPIPAIKIARLAVDETVQGKGFGKALLKDALIRCITASESIGARAVIVDALNDDVRAFYEKFGFESLFANQNPMMILMKDLKASFVA